MRPVPKDQAAALRLEELIHAFIYTMWQIRLVQTGEFVNHRVPRTHQAISINGWKQQSGGTCQSVACVL